MREYRRTLPHKLTLMLTDGDVRDLRAVRKRLPKEAHLSAWLRNAIRHAVEKELQRA